MKIKTKPEIGINILSVLLAFLVWFAVMSLGDPQVSKRINGIKVAMLNGSAIEDLDKIYSVKNDSDTISINVRDKRSIVDRLTAEDFVARADLSKWNELGNVPIVVTCKNSRLDVNNYVQSSYSLQLEVEDIKNQTFPIDLKIEGEPVSGYTVGNSYVSPETVIIEGGESVINRIERVETSVDIRGLIESQDIETPLTVYDSLGNVIPNEKLEFISLAKNIYSVNSSIVLLKTNKIPIVVETSGRIPEGYMVKSVECEPSLIEVKGNSDKISRLQSVRINDNSFSLTGITETFTKEVDINKYLPIGVVNAGKKKQRVTVKVTIVKLDSFDLNIPFNEIKLKNLPENLNFEIMGTGSSSIKLYGPSDVLFKLDSEKVKPSLDLQSCDEERTYRLDLELKLPEGCFSSASNVVYVRCYRPDNQPDETIEGNEEEEAPVLPDE